MRASVVRWPLLLAWLAACSSDSNDVAAPPQTLPPLTSGTLVVNRTAGLLTVGQSQRLVARASDDRGASVNVAVTWSSSAPDKVSVDATGQIVARAIGSAMITAQSGSIKTTPIFIIVVEPRPGALLVRDDQVMAVGPPMGLAPGEIPGLGTRYEVRLNGVAIPPSFGAVVLATENAAVAGKVVSTRNESGALVVTLAVAPLSQLLTRYDIDWKIDLSAYPAVLDQGGAGASIAVRIPAPSPNALPTPADANIITPFTALQCEASLAPVLLDRTVSLVPTINLELQVQDSPGHSRRALVGDAKLVGTISAKLRAGFKVTGKCQAQVLIRIPVGGLLAVGVMPGVRLGVGVSLSGLLVATAGELSVTGEYGSHLELGWECGGASASCQSLDVVTPINDMKAKADVTSPVHGMRVQLEGQFFALAGLDAVFFTAWSAGILEARFGPVQSVDLGFEEDQADNPTYASNYEMKLEAVVEPGGGLQAVLDLFAGPGISLTFQGKVSRGISESPRGTLSVSKPVVGLSGESVDFTVNLSSTDYLAIGYNVDRVELWRKNKDGDFEKFKAFAFTQSGSQSVFTYRWTPTTDDLGTNEFAAFVFTKLTLPGLEVALNSIAKVDVKCFSGPRVIGTNVVAANVCADEWVGTATFDFPGELHIDAFVTWKRDPDNPEIEGGVYYVPTGQALVRHIGWENKGCSVSQSTYVIDPTAGSSLFVDYKPSPPTFEGSGGIAGVSKLTCPDAPPIDYAFGWLFWQGAGQLKGNGTVIEGTLTLGGGTWQWHFERP